MRGPILFLFALCLVNAQMNNSIIKLSTDPNLQWKPWATFPTHYLQPKSTSTAISTIKPTPATSNVVRLLVNCTEFMVIIVSLRFTPQPARKYDIMLLLIRTFVLPIFETLVFRLAQLNFFLRDFWSPHTTYLRFAWSFWRHYSWLQLSVVAAQLCCVVAK